MQNSTISFEELDGVDLGDRDLSCVKIDLVTGEARLLFSSALVIRAGGTREEVANPTLVLKGMRSIATSPPSSRPESIVLRWRFSRTSSGFSAEVLVIGNPEPVTLKFEGSSIHMEY